MLPVSGITGNNWKAKLEPVGVAHPPSTVTGQADLPVQGEGGQGSHPPGQEDSAAKPFWTQQSWSWPSSRPGASVSARGKEIKINTLKLMTTEIQTPTPSRMMTGRKLGRKFDIEEEEDRRKKKMEHIAA